MADNTHIEWTDATWNPVTGCSIVSPGCTNCYAMKLAGTRLKHIPSRAGLTIDTKAGPVWNGQVRLNEEWLTQPLRWKRPRMIFVCAHGDLFHENVPDEWIDRIFAVMALCRQHTFQVLTKRAKRMREYLDGAWARREALGDLMGEIGGDDREGWFAPECDGKRGWVGMCLPLPNVWLGVSAERQQEADERVPDLLATSAAIRFVSAEPLLGPIDFYATSATMPVDGHPWRNGPILQGIHWIIVGGESGQGARPMHHTWARSIRDQCATAQVPFFFKQWGAHVGGAQLRTGWYIYENGNWTPNADHVFGDGYAALRVGKKEAGRMLDGVEHNGMPAPREVPAL